MSLYGRDNVDIFITSSNRVKAQSLIITKIAMTTITVALYCMTLTCSNQVIIRDACDVVGSIT